MLVSKYDPFKEFEKRFFAYPTKNQEDAGISGFVPTVNTREGEFAYHIDVDLPGVKKEDITVDVHDNTLTISGERKHKAEVKEDDYYKLESSYGKFQRSFALPDSVDVENIDAATDNGVLEIVIPKMKTKTQKKKIEVK